MVQVTLCALLVTSSLVAARGLVRSLDADYGFEPRGVCVVNTNLAMAGYEGPQWLPAQKRMIAALEAIPGVEGVAPSGKATGRVWRWWVWPPSTRRSCSASSSRGPS